MTSWAAERQREIYNKGKDSRKVPVSYEELEFLAAEVMPREAYDFIAGGAGSEATLRFNREAFDNWKIVPRVLRGVSEPDLQTKILGKVYPFPVLLAPVGIQGVVHPEGEKASCRAAAALGFPVVLSTVSSCSLEQAADILGPTERWFQLYWSRNREINASLVSRAESAGYSVIVVTVDATHPGWRERDLDNAFLPFLCTEGLANYFTDPVFRASLSTPPEEDLEAAMQHVASLSTDPALTWDDLKYLRGKTDLPIFLKGILSAQDAQIALDMGLDGIIVSNHGGRQLDGAIAALDALPQIADVVDEHCPVLLDSGIRGGSDVLRALALGADAVLLGRPFVFGLAVDGENGVREVLLNFLSDLELAVAVAGCSSVGEISKDLICRI